jgi:hypothetical protein
MSVQSVEDRKAIQDAMLEMSASFSRAEGEREFQRECIKNLAEKLSIEKSILRKMARVYHASNFHTVSAEQDEFETVYQEVFGVVEDV